MSCKCPKNSEIHRTVIHIGHTKTGSSFLQSRLVQNRQLLELNGLNYPKAPSDDDALKGKVTSGNGHLLRACWNFESKSQCTLYSSEGLFSSPLLDRIKETSGGLRSKIDVVFYTRNPFEWIRSVWMQNLERGKYSKGIDEFIIEMKPWRTYEKICAYIESSKVLNFELRIFNYSQHHGDLWRHFVKFGLGLDGSRETDASESNAVVNRSLGYLEAEFLLTFQKAAPQIDVRPMTSHLINETGTVQKYSAEISPEVRQHFTEKLLPLVDTINSELQRSEQLSLEMSTTQSVVDPENQANSELIKQALNLAASVPHLPILSASDLNLLRDIAIKSASSNLEPESKARLLELVLKYRPHSPRVKTLLNLIGSSQK